MCKKINHQYVIYHFDGSYKNAVGVCLTESKSKFLLPIIANCIMDNCSLSIEHIGESSIEFNQGRVWIEEIPILTDKHQVYHLFCMPEE